MTEQTRPGERPDDRGDARSEVSTPRTRVRSRMRQAMVCPYCRDDVGRHGTVACARRGCGALYHRECWDEVAASYGGCAVFGCESKKAREVSLAGYFTRLVRMFFAALFFTPRVLGAVADPRDRRSRAVLRRALEVGWAASPFSERLANGPVKLILYLLASPPALVLAGVLYSRWEIQPGLVAMSAMLLIPIVAAFVLALGFLAAKAFAVALANEVSALGRAAAPENTVLGRIRRGGAPGKE